MHGVVMRIAAWRGMTGRAFRLARVMRGMAGPAVPVPLQRHLGGVAVGAGQAGARGDVDVVSERDVARPRGVGHLEVQRQADRSLNGDVVRSMARRACQGAGRVMMAGRAIPRSLDTRRAMCRSSAVTAAAGQIVVRQVGKPSSHQRVTREPQGRVLDRDA